jgi:hypothetical protein
MSLLKLEWDQWYVFFPCPETKLTEIGNLELGSSITPNLNPTLSSTTLYAFFIPVLASCSFH